MCCRFLFSFPSCELNPHLHVLIERRLIVAPDLISTRAVLFVIGSSALFPRGAEEHVELLAAIYLLGGWQRLAFPYLLVEVSVGYVAGSALEVLHCADTVSRTHPVFEI